MHETIVNNFGTAYMCPYVNKSTAISELSHALWSICFMLLTCSP